MQTDVHNDTHSNSRSRNSSKETFPQKTNLKVARKEDLEKINLQKDYTGNWVVRAVSALLDTKDFQHSPNWIAVRLGVSVKEIVDALETLEKLGIIQRTENGYKKILKYVYFSDRDMNPFEICADHVLISTQILGRLNPGNPEVGSFYRTGFVASTKSQMRKFFLKVEELMKELLIESQAPPTSSELKNESQEIYAFTLSGIELSLKDQE